MPNEINVVTRSHARAAADSVDQIRDNSLNVNDSLSSNSSNSNISLPNFNSNRGNSAPQYSSSNQFNPNIGSKVVVVSDENEINSIIQEFHDNPVGGHQGITRTFRRIRKYYYFTKMFQRIRKYINTCDSCQKNKVRKLTKCPMRITTTSKCTFEKVCMDIVGPLPVSYNGYKYILTLEDDLSKFVVAIPIINQEARTVAKAFVTQFICTFGVPKSIQHDQGSNFMSQMFNETCKILRIRKLNSTAYHPQSNAVERYHRSLGEYFRNFCEKDPLNWDEWLPYACFVQNSTPHSMTNFMPYELVFRNTPNLPHHFFLNLNRVTITMIFHLK